MEPRRRIRSRGTAKNTIREIKIIEGDQRMGYRIISIGSGIIVAGAPASAAAVAEKKRYTDRRAVRDAGCPVGHGARYFTSVVIGTQIIHNSRGIGMDEPIGSTMAEKKGMRVSYLHCC